jgi:hypothetical protein
MYTKQFGRKDLGICQEIIQLHNTARQCMADFKKTALATVGWKIMNCPSYSLDLVCSDFQLFGSLKVHIEEQKFQTDDERECSVLNWLHKQDKTFYAAGISNLPEQRKKKCQC